MRFVLAAVLEFQSTLPVGGATSVNVVPDSSLLFQSTLPVGGATTRPLVFHLRNTDFNPRSPWGERLCYCQKVVGHS